jgi:alpha-L-fucosidase
MKMFSLAWLIIPPAVFFAGSCVSVLAAENSALELKLPIAAGPFHATDESLKQYKYPEWFRDAKFGMWSHWGPQAVPRKGDWYAKKMYESDQGVDKKTGQPKGPSDDYKYHVAHYGHPSKFGYKDIIPLWKAEKWEPDKLMALYKKAGAKYFVSMGVHHDNFALWDSKLHKWNAVNMGPKKDVVGIWQKAAKKEGLRFGVSEHLGASFTWFQTSHGSDASGPMAGIPYDGADPKYQDLYHPKAAPDDKGWLSKNPEWHQEWYNRIKELVDNYQPDLLYSDSGLPFDNVGHSLIAHYYNQDIAKNGGKLDAVYNCKQSSDGRWTQDVERGVMDEISPYPWQTDTSIGDWYYRTGQKYKSGGDVVRMLIDIVSKNGNLLINVVQTPEGDLEPDMLKTLDEIGAWIAANGEGIYATRPWKVYGEKAGSDQAAAAQPVDGEKKVMFNEGKNKYSADDIRFTASKDGKTVYAFCLGVPAGEVRIKSLAGEKIAGVIILGSDEKPAWKQEDGRLIIQPAAKWPNEHAVGFKIQLTN